MAIVIFRQGFNPPAITPIAQELDREVREELGKLRRGARFPSTRVELLRLMRQVRYHMRDIERNEYLWEKYAAKPNSNTSRYAGKAMEHAWGELQHLLLGVFHELRHSRSTLSAQLLLDKILDPMDEVPGGAYRNHLGASLGHLFAVIAALHIGDAALVKSWTTQKIELVKAMLDCPEGWAKDQNICRKANVNYHTARRYIGQMRSAGYIIKRTRSDEWILADQYRQQFKDEIKAQKR